ncbi:MAG: alkyl hydroperoxide reductase [Deltaproteobacteria bacterium GWC2_42_11]|nr:MAG: alkyl hydroperoxide reductase [Deltaproteobacteria bacterium GWC2_42_11]
MPSYRDDKPRFDGYDAHVLGISVDSIPSHKAWEKTLGGLNYPLLSDFYPHGMVAEKYGVLRNEGYCERAIFIIDKQGIIRYSEVYDIGKKPPNYILFKELEKVQK